MFGLGSLIGPVANLAGTWLDGHWKDEWLTILFSIPLVLAFVPGCEDIVQIGFAQLQLMPDWYKYALSVIVAASFGVRSATKLFKK